MLGITNALIHRVAATVFNILIVADADNPAIIIWRHIVLSHQTIIEWRGRMFVFEHKV